MTTERPDEDALCEFMNGSDRPVDVSVNYRDEAYTTVEPEEEQAVFSVDSDADGVYGTYTFEARKKDDPEGSDASVLASAAVTFEAGDCYTAVFHPIGDDDYQLSVYEVDFSPSAASRFRVHHVGSHERVDWSLAPKAEADPQVAADERSGTLEQGQWQQAIDVTPNEYRLEVVVDEAVVAFRPDLELEPERMTACYVVGEPTAEMGPDEKQAHVFRQRFHVPAGPERDDETTPPAEPHATTDDNETVAFDCDPPTMYETNQYGVQIEATDPDGIVSGLAVDIVDPAVDGFRIPGDSFSAPTEVGEPATATLQVPSTVVPGTYDVHVTANPDGLGQRVTCPVPVEIEPVTADRLLALVEYYHDNDAITGEVANELVGLLADAGASAEERSGVLDELLDDVLDVFGAGDSTDDDADPRAALADVAALVTERQGDGISDAAAADLETETDVLLSRLETQ